jgi:hypothetical protein
MAYLELLDRTEVLANLDRTRVLLEEQLASGAELPRPLLEDEVSREELQSVLEAVAASVGAESASESLDEAAAYLPRDPTISGFQMGVERHASQAERAGAETAIGAEPVSVADLAGLDEQPRLPVLTDRRLPLPMEIAEEAVEWPEPGTFRPWPHDFLWAGVIGAGLAQRAVRGPSDFNPHPATHRLEEDARAFVFGDWGTGIPRAVWLSSRIRALLQDDARPSHLIHLGDVYYAGFPWECRDRALSAWPAPGTDPDRAVSWDLNGNHDMYSGGYGYFRTLLGDARFGQQRSADGKPTSIFELTNDHWLVLGLDTAWSKGRFRVATEGDLVDREIEWIQEAIVRADSAGQKVVLLSHHQLFSAFDEPTMLDEKIGEFLRGHRVHAWFWGHEHRCTLYKPAPEVTHARCIGNGGVPAYVSSPDAVKRPELVEFDFEEAYHETYRGRQVLLFAFAVLEFDGPNLQVTYVNEYGQTWHVERL